MRVRSIQHNQLTKTWHINVFDWNEQIRFKPIPGSTVEECRLQFRKQIGLEEPTIEEEIDNLRLRTPDNIYAAMLALKEIGEQAVEPLVQSLLEEKESPTFQDRVVDTLKMIDSSKTTALLIKALEDLDTRKRWSAIRALAKIGDNGAIEPLKQLIAVETSVLPVPNALPIDLKKNAEEALKWIIASGR